MGRRKSKPEEIRNKTAYAYAWLHFDKIQRVKAESEIRKHEVHIGKWESGESSIPPDLIENISGDFLDEHLSKSRQDWLETISNPKLYEVLKTMSSNQLTLIYLCLIEGFTQREVSKIISKHQSYIAREISAIKKKIVKEL